MVFAYVPSYAQASFSGRCLDRHLHTYQVKANGRFHHYLANDRQAANQMATNDGLKFDPWDTRIQHLDMTLVPITA